MTVAGTESVEIYKFQFQTDAIKQLGDALDIQLV